MQVEGITTADNAHLRLYRARTRLARKQGRTKIRLTGTLRRPCDARPRIADFIFTDNGPNGPERVDPED